MPLTAEQEKAGTRQLRQWLENDQRLVCLPSGCSDFGIPEYQSPVESANEQVTFRDLSRAVACHVDLAKKYFILVRPPGQCYNPQRCLICVVSD